MAEKLLMLALSPTMEEGLLVKWHKDVGDTVEEGQLVAEVETDKATMELESFLAGTILKLLVNEGESVPVGSPIAIIGEEGEDVSDMDEDSAPADEAGDDERVSAKDIDVDLDTSDDAKPSQPSASEDGKRIKSSPLARNMAEEAGIELASVSGSGPGGRIIKRDVEAAIEDRKSAPAQQATATSIPTFQPSSWAEDVEPVPLSGMRRTIARRLTQSWLQAPHFFLEASIDMGAAWDFRKQLNAALAQGDNPRKVSFNDLVVKACALALQDHPEINVAFADDGMRTFEGSHIGVAVAVSEGLVVPVVRDAHRKGLATIGAETRELAAKARDKKLKPDEMTGSTFSVSNLGMFGIDAFTAVINPPEACILAVGRINKIPVVREDDTLGVGKIMRVTLSCDHRAVDGATGARFLDTLRTYLENPLLLAA